MIHPAAIIVIALLTTAVIVYWSWIECRQTR